MKAPLFSFLFLFITATDAKVYSNCELSAVLNENGMANIDEYKLEDWLCMAYHESKYDTRAVGPPNTDGSIDYGIFQINSRYWCSNGQGETANGCGKPCSAFTDDDITDDIVCAKRIVKDPNRMDAWVAWRNNCKGKDLSEYSHGCNL